jgi:hypothetical protein
MSSGRLLVLLCTVPLVVVLVAGCGGDTEDSSAAPISKADFVKETEAICKKGQARLHAGFEALINEKEAHRSRLDEEEEWVRKVIAPNITRETSEIRALGTPKGEEEKVGRLLAAIEAGLHNLEENPQSVLASSAKTFSKAIKLETAYGLEVCAQNY